MKVEKKIIKVKVSDIIFKEDIYARFKSDQSLIDEYAENADEILENGNKVSVSKDLILIDGYHRWKGIHLAKGENFEFEVVMHDTDNTDYIELESYAGNTRHGKRNSRKENIRNVRRLFMKGHTIADIQKYLGLSKALVYDATTEIRKQQDEERNEKIVQLYLKAENTQRGIAKLMGLDHKTVGKISTSGEIPQDFKPLLYNIWNLSKQDNERKHYGAFPELFMENLLHYHTKPLDIVYDPFGGGGTTVDVCKRMMRRYYVSDRKVVPGRENDIKEWDVANGLPDNLPKPNLVFLDPPYWRQAANKYSEDAEDLGNMTLEQFNDAMNNLLSNLKNKKVERIAIVIAPACHHTLEPKYVDHIFDFHKMLNGYDIEMRYVMPYSTEIFRGSQIEAHKKSGIVANINRDLVIWRKR